jgi:glutathione S-transferase
MEATLYGFGISHPVQSVRLMLAHKGIEPRLVTLPVGSQQIAMRALGFRHGTVPGVKLDGRRVQGSREISRALDDVVSEPSLFPRDSEQRPAVEDAERWGEAVYQPVPRRIFRWAVASNGKLRQQLLAMLRTPAPAITARAVWPVAQFYVRLEGGGEDAARADVAALPAHLDRVDELIEAGVLDSDEPNAADFQIAPTTRVLLNFPQLRPLVEGRPAAAHAMRVIPKFGREMPIQVPSEWVPQAA